MKMIWIRRICFAIIGIGYVKASCSLTTVNSKTQQYGEYYNNLGQRRNGYHYPILQRYFDCINLQVRRNQNLNSYLSTPNIQQRGMKTQDAIRFINSSVPVLGVESFINISDVTAIFLNLSHVEDLQPGAFNNLQILKTINLSYNNISKISRGVFNHLSVLVQIDLNHNVIKTVEMNSFLGLKNLQEIFLDYNLLTVISPDHFLGLQSLISIGLSHNKISNLSEILPESTRNATNLAIDLSFNNLASLNLSDIPLRTSELNLGNNAIKSIYGEIKPSLRKIFLNSNKILSPPTIDTPIEHLNLSGNVIEDLDLGVFGTNTIITLHLNNNSIKILHKDLFDNLTNLELLDLQENDLDYLPSGLFQALSSLQYLNISGNKLSEFEFGTFFGLHNLKCLDISNNSLTYLTQGMLHPLNKLTELYIGNNLISTIEATDFLVHLKELKKVSLKNNPWICEALLRTVTKFVYKNIYVEKVMQNKTTNVNGIACYDHKIYKKQLEETTSINPSDSNYNWNQFNNFFNEGFFNTSFYNFFKNNTNLEFEHKLTNIFQKQIDDTINKLGKNLYGTQNEASSKSQNCLCSSDEQNNFVLFVIIITILVCILFIMLFKTFRKLLICFKKQNPVVFLSNISNANLELL